MLLFLQLHSQVGKPTLTPSLGHGTHQGKDKVQPQPFHACTSYFSCCPPAPPFPIPTAQQLCWNSIPCSLQPGPGAGRHLQHFVPVPVARGVPKAQLKVGSSEGAQPGRPEAPSELGRRCKNTAM